MDHLQHLFNTAFAAFDKGEFTQTIAACEAVLNINPAHPEAFHLLSHAHKALGNADLASALLYRAIALQPDHPQYHYNAAVNATESGNEQRAMTHYAQALRVQPDLPDALWNYGECLRMNEQFDLALACFERLVALGRSQYQGLWHRMAVCYASLNRHDEAQVMFLRAIDAGDTLTRWEYALHQLSLENFENGFQYYNDRFSCEGRNSVFCHNFPYPLWDGQLSEGQTILIHGEQGLGDELMFASLFNELIADAQKHQAHIVIACKPPVARLFADCFPDAEIRAHKVGEMPADVSDLNISAQLPMGHLQRLSRHCAAAFDAHRGAHFKADKSRREYYAQRLIELGRERVDGKRRMRVGLMWGSNPAAVSAKFTRWSSQRSIHIALFERFAEFIDDIEFVSLQNAERGAEAALAPHLHIVDFSFDQADFFDTAALMANLDWVISVDTSVSHLAGGMAIPTWVPLMSRADWRHGRSRRESLWYHNTRYFRQRTANDWSGVLDEMHDALRIELNLWKNQTNAS